jgi:hypothetical protein
MKTEMLRMILQKMLEMGATFANAEEAELAVVYGVISIAAETVGIERATDLVLGAGTYQRISDESYAAICGA